MKKILLLLFFILCPTISFASSGHIQSYTSDIYLQQSDSAIIKETIEFNCASCRNKHGIYRIIPRAYKLSDDSRAMLGIKNISIKDDNGQKYPFTKSENIIAKTITLKIGDENVVIDGQTLTYVISYEVRNIIDFTGSGHDLFYWNLSGNYWQIPIHAFQANIYFPQTLHENNVKHRLYLGRFGDIKNKATTTIWNGSKLSISVKDPIKSGEGVTIRAIIPKEHFFQP